MIDRGLLVSSQHEVVLVVEEAVGLAHRDDHVAEVVRVDDLEGPDALTRVGLQKVLWSVEVEVAHCCVGVELGWAAIHLEGLDLGVVGVLVDSVIDHSKLSVVLVVLKHQP